MLKITIPGENLKRWRSRETDLEISGEISAGQSLAASMSLVMTFSEGRSCKAFFASKIRAFDPLAISGCIGGEVIGALRTGKVEAAEFGAIPFAGP